MLEALSVGLGGFFGSIFRYGISLIPYNSAFPVMTFVVNVLGAFIIGFFTAIFDNRQYNHNFVLFTRVGLCGGFTTFSTFSHDVIVLFDNHKYFIGIIYVILSIASCILGVYLGRLVGSFVRG